MREIHLLKTRNMKRVVLLGAAMLPFVAIAGYENDSSSSVAGKCYSINDVLAVAGCCAAVFLCIGFLVAYAIMSQKIHLKKMTAHH